MSTGSGTVEKTDGFITILDFRVYCKKYAPKNNNNKDITIVLLHGAAFSSQTWEDIGTLQHLAEQGIIAFAIDLPGYGKSPRGPVENKEAFLQAAVDYIGGKVKLIISPSMSGSYSIPYLNVHGDEIDGYVPVAPVSIRSLDPPTKIKKSLHVFAVVGELDAGGVAGLKTFNETFDNYSQLIIKEGKHPAYLKDPDLFNSELTKFAISLS